MKKLLIIMILWSISILGKVHPNISLKYLQGDKEGSFLEEMIDINRSELRFEKKDGRYDVFIYDSNGRKNIIDSFEEEREILSVFFYEISGDGLKEIFMITRYRDEYQIYSYGVSYDRFSYFFGSLNKLNKVLNTHFKNSKNLNASMIKKELKGKVPLDYGSLEFWPTDKDKFYRDIDFLKGQFLGYYDSRGNKVISSDEADYYLKRYRDNIYGKFGKVESFSLTSVFEGRTIEQPPYYVKDGRYRSSYGDGYEEGSYTNDIKHGNWEIIERMYHTYGMYDMGEKNGQWWLNGYKGKFVNDLKSGLWIREDGTEEEFYTEGNLTERRIYSTENRELIEKTIYSKDGGCITKEYSGPTVIKKRTRDNKGKYRTEEYDRDGKLIYLTKDDGARIKVDSYKHSNPKSLYESIEWDDLEYLGELKVYGQIAFSRTYLLKNSKNVNAYRGKIYKKNLGEKDLFFMVVKKDGSRYYWIHEIFEGHMTDGKFPSNIVREGKNELFARGENIIETGNYKNNELNGTMFNYSSDKVYQEINFNQGKWHGAYKEYDGDGKLITHSKYEMGKKVEEVNDIDIEAAVNNFFRNLSGK